VREMKVALNDNKVGEYLKSLRQGMGISQNKLADISGITVSHICRMEKGNRIPSGAMVVKLASALGLVEKELLAMAGHTGEPITAESTKLLLEAIDPSVVEALEQETPDIQRRIIHILLQMKETARTMSSPSVSR
jgi:transcriptional regulator with XRE-family HTH domain